MKIRTPREIATKKLTTHLFSLVLALALALALSGLYAVVPPQLALLSTYPPSR